MDKRWPSLALIAGSALVAAACGASPATAPARHAHRSRPSYQPPSNSSGSAQASGSVAIASGSASATSGSVAAASGSASTASGSAVVRPTLAITEVGWDYSVDSPAVWVQATDDLSTSLNQLRVKATFVNPATNVVLGTDTEYLAGGGYGAGGGSLQPGQSSVPVEVVLLDPNSLGNPFPVNAVLQWSRHTFGGWHTWKTVSVPGGPPPGPFANGQTASLPTPAKNVLSFEPVSSTTTILQDVMAATGHVNHESGSTFVGTVTEQALPNGQVEVTWSVPLATSPSAAASGAMSLVSGNPAIFQFSITSGGSTLNGLNSNAQNVMNVLG